MPEEAAVLSWYAVAALLAATLVRALAPVIDPERTTLHHGIAASLAVLAFGGWLLAAWPRLLKPRAALLRP
jgi:uncharacterized protein involved in response to NO